MMSPYFGHVSRVAALIGMIAGVPGLAAAFTTCPPPATGAFTGCYYNNQTLSGDPVFVRTDNQIDFYWGNGSPDASLQPLNFSARWQGNFMFSAGTYTFSVVASDGMRLYVDGNLILNAWRDQPPYFYIATQAISQGSHLVTVEYYEKQGGATAQVAWQNTSPANSQAPVISSFTSTPNSTAPGNPVTLAWNVSGATSVSIDNGVGDVTSRSSITVSPVQTTTYNLTATNGSGSTAASVTATVTSAPPGDTQPPSVPTLVSATAASSTQVNLAWTASTDNVGVTGYQVTRNGSVAGSVPGTVLAWSDTSVSAGTTYVYSVKAYDGAGNYSAASNSVPVTTPAGAAPPSGTCPAPATNAFTGCYYNNQTLSGDPVFVRTDAQLNFDWGNHSPDPSLQPLNFSVRWQGYFTFSQGTYIFSVITSDGMRLYADGNLILNAWRDQSPNSYTVSQAMSQGSHLITVEYYERQGGATAQVTWQNTSGNTQAPVISSFTSTPSTTAPGIPVTLAWSVSGATSVSIDNGVGDVTSRSSVTVSPAQTTTYTLTATGSSGSASAAVQVTVSPGADTQPPTVPTLLSATAASAVEVDLAWSASTDNVGVAGYQIFRNGTAIASVPGAVLAYADTTATAATTYIYTVSAYDAAGNHSAQSNQLQATTQPGPTISVTWYGGCWYNGTINGVTGNFQAVDFAMTTSTPVAVQGTLFFGSTCDTSLGTDNLNDFGTLFGSTHMILGFSYHHDETPTSALYWMGDRTSDGQCPKGAPCSGCIHYTAATPTCDKLP